MELLRSIRFERSYAKAPHQVQRAFDKQPLLLLHNLQHPSLRAKKYDEGQNLWSEVTKEPYYDEGNTNTTPHGGLATGTGRRLRHPRIPSSRAKARSGADFSSILAALRVL